MKLKKPRLAGITKLIDAIESHSGKEFIMRGFNIAIVNRAGKECGTAFCIAGWAKELRDPKGVRNEMAEEALNIMLYGKNTPEIEALTYPLYTGEGILLGEFDNLPHATRKKVALEVLAHFRDTGEVDWKKFTPRRVHFGGQI